MDLTPVTFPSPVSMEWGTSHYLRGESPPLRPQAGETMGGKGGWEVSSLMP